MRRSNAKERCATVGCCRRSALHRRLGATAAAIGSCCRAAAPARGAGPSSPWRAAEARAAEAGRCRRSALPTASSAIWRRREVRWSSASRAVPPRHRRVWQVLAVLLLLLLLLMVVVVITTWWWNDAATWRTRRATSRWLLAGPSRRVNLLAPLQ